MKFVPQSFLEVAVEDSFWRRVRTILILAPCTKSAVCAPADLIVNDGEDLSLLAPFSARFSPHRSAQRLRASRYLCREVLIRAAKCTVHLQYSNALLQQIRNRLINYLKRILS